MKAAIIFCIALTGCIISCNSLSTANAGRVVVVQPLGDFSPQQTQQIVKALAQIHQQVILRKSRPLPTVAYYAPRNRYRADAIIADLKGFGNASTVVLGLTDKDISTTKGSHYDWGIMGLGYTPGPACIVSSYRLKKNNRSAQLYKLVLHELGHTQGLPHCAVKSCYMRDAEGGNHLNEEKSFCNHCNTFLSAKGWKL